MAIVREYTKTIDGTAYTTRTLPATLGLSVMPRLVALLGDKIMPLLFEVGETGVGELLQNPAIVGQIISNIAERLTKRRVEGDIDPTSVLRDMMHTTKTDRIRIGTEEVPGSVWEHFDEHFAGNYKHLINVVGWVGRVNFMPPSAESL